MLDGRAPGNVVFLPGERGFAMGISGFFIVLWLVLGYIGYLVVIFGDGENRVLDAKRLLIGFVASMGGGALLAAAVYDQFLRGRRFRTQEESLSD
jgi:hypothetical protein